MLQNNVSLEGKTIFVTGASGFIGGNLCNRLLNDVNNVKVVGIDNMNDYYDVHIKEERLKQLAIYDSQFIFIKGSITDKALVNKVFVEYTPLS